jgi:hypothetical protein
MRGRGKGQRPKRHRERETVEAGELRNSKRGFVCRLKE